MILIVFFRESLFSISFDTLSTPCFTVEWSLPPSKDPIIFRGVSVMERQRYMAIWRALVVFASRLALFKSATEIPKCSETVSMISSGVIFRFSSGEIRSFKASAASEILISSFFNLYSAISLLREPSSSRMLDLMLVAINCRTSSGIW